MRTDTASPRARRLDVAGLNNEHGSSDIVRSVSCVPCLIHDAGIRNPGPL